MFPSTKNDLSKDITRFSSKDQKEVSISILKRVSFHTLGCRLNQSETNLLVRSFKQRNYIVVLESETADICVINTCTVTESSNSKNRQTIRAVHRLNPEAIIAVVGCYAQIDPEEIACLEGVRLVIGNEEKMLLADYLQDIEPSGPPMIIRSKISKKIFTLPIIKDSFSEKKEIPIQLPVSDHVVNYQNKPHLSTISNKKSSLNMEEGSHFFPSKITSPDFNLIHPKSYFDKTSLLKKTRASLKIQDGCDFMCSFCIIPFARGRSRYREFSNVKEESKMLVQEGIREIVLTGVNVGTYNTGRLNIVDVIDYLNSITELKRIRISSIEPTTVPKILFQYMNDPQHKLVPFFHLPVQSGIDTILKKMKRRYSIAQYSDEIWSAFESVEDLCIGTDIMVGFPEESDSEFDNTFNLLEKLPLTYFHVFPFSPRKGTPAYQMEGQINPNIKKKRSEILRNLSISKRLDFHKRFLGKTRKVLWEERRKNNKYTGYTDNYIRVILDENYNADLRNQIHPVKLNRINGQNMLAKFVS